MSVLSSSSVRTQLAARLGLLAGELAAAPHANAAVVNLDLGPSGYNILGPNGGLGSSTFRSVNYFPAAAGTVPSIYLHHDSTQAGISGVNQLWFAINGGVANPRRFVTGDTIDSTITSWSYSSGSDSQFRNGANVSANFGAGSYMGFSFYDYFGTYYGYIEVTWDSSTDTFEILSAAYESTGGVGIVIPAGGGGGVPLPGAAGLAACGLLGLSRRRR
jgi:hypothetical protein